MDGQQKTLCAPITHTHTGRCHICVLLPAPAAMVGKEEEAEVEASDRGSRAGEPKASEGPGRLPEGGCWMVWMEWPPSMEGKLGGESKSYSSLTMSPELGPELVRVSPDKSENQDQKAHVNGKAWLQWDRGATSPLPLDIAKTCILNRRLNTIIVIIISV